MLLPEAVARTAASRRREWRDIRTVVVVFYN